MRNWKTPLKVSLFWLVVFILLAEIVLRQRDDLNSWNELNGKGFTSGYDAESLTDSWLLVRDQDKNILEVPEFTYHLDINKEGIRDREHPVEKPTDEFRIIGLGDSFTEGAGAAFDSTWLQVLQHHFNQEFDNTNIRVICGGVSGSDPYFEYQLLQQRLLKYEPDLVLVTINSSDIADIKYRGGMERFLPDSQLQFRDPPSIDYLFRYSYITRFIVLRILAWDWHYQSFQEKVAENKKTLRLVETAILNINSTSQTIEKGQFKTIVVLHPLLHELQAGRYNYYWPWLQTELKAHEITVIDLLPYYLQHLENTNTKAEEYYWPNDGHFNGEGYRIFAEGVKEKLFEMKALPAKDTTSTL